MLDISFIVPIYNNKPADLKKCLSSINEVKNLSYEIIVVDDGSLEKLGNCYTNICSTFAATMYIKTKNQGVSAARNLGLTRANGKYVSFVDADDELKGSAISKNDVSKNKDIIIYNYILYPSNEIISLNDFSNLDSLSKLQRLALKNSALNVVFAKLFLREFLVRNNIRFDINQITGEDFTFVTAVLFAHPSFLYLKRIVYKYNFDRQSYEKRMLTYPERYLINIFSIYDIRRKIIKVGKLSGSVKKKLVFNEIDEIFSYYLTIVCMNEVMTKKIHDMIVEKIPIICTTKLDIIRTLKVFLIKIQSISLLKTFYKIRNLFRNIKQIMKRG